VLSFWKNASKRIPIWGFWVPPHRPVHTTQSWSNCFTSCLWCLQNCGYFRPSNDSVFFQTGSSQFCSTLILRRGCLGKNGEIGLLTDALKPSSVALKNQLWPCISGQHNTVHQIVPKWVA
jgi:hypothetical protein